MNRIEFMRELEGLLLELPDSEREEALQYYSDYLEDAGVENEEEVIASLGSPKKVADTIKAGLFSENAGAFTDTGYQAYEKKEQDNIIVREAASEGTEDWKAAKKEEASPENEKGKGLSTGVIVLIILLSLLAAPVIIPLILAFLATILALLLALFATVFSIFITVAAVAFSLLLAGVALAGVGVVKVFVSPLGGITLFGGGIVCLGLGLVFLALTVWLFAKAIPAMVRGVIKLFKKLFSKKGGAKA